MKSPTVILVCGYARAGKDTFADAVLDLIPGARKPAGCAESAETEATDRQGR